MSLLVRKRVWAQESQVTDRWKRSATGAAVWESIIFHRPPQNLLEAASLPGPPSAPARKACLEARFPASKQALNFSRSRSYSGTCKPPAPAGPAGTAPR